MPADLMSECEALARRARAAGRLLALADTRAKNAWLRAAAAALEAAAAEVLDADDLRAAPGFGLSPAMVDRLRLTRAGLGDLAAALQQVAGLPDPVGEVREGGTRPNGLQVLKVGVPLGVVFFLYESRPNVTADAAALCVKSGNAVILRGGKEAAHTNAALHRLLAGELPGHGLPADAVQLVPTADRDAVGHFLKLSQYIDLCIPRGGESLIRRVAAEATMPVLKHHTGNCHVYVDASAECGMAERIVVNGKCQRPGVCNATESLLVHEGVAADFLPKLAATLAAHGVELRGCARTCELVPAAVPATDADFAAEFLALVLSVKVVPSLEAACDHIARFGSGHTDAIVTADVSAARRFVARVDSSAVVVNASTRFNDGGELGLGAEVGISTDRFHARGPCGLRELTTYKWVVTGDGHVRG
jgi:glutamate-5-semialdehyde dehydrogenase